MSHEVKRQGEHGGGDALEVQLPPIVSSLIDDADTRQALSRHDLVARLRGAEASIGEQA